MAGSSGHWVGTVGQTVVVAGHSVATGGHSVGCTGHSVTPPVAEQMVTACGQSVGFDGEEHNVGPAGQVV